ncbi:HNH endonuclease [Tabrizicola sp.]|uniref:HNH endonuclease n=1 Tax=Tabrizicola sp. TaxID=2005166 RepID=UPI002869F3A0|nr:HNH endonuclease [Tabrizicola sp.]
MAPVPKAAFERCFHLGLDVYDGKVSANAAVAEATALGMNETSARDTIYVVRCMAEGRRYARGLSAPQTEFALSYIRDRMGKARFENALKALDGHIEYYEGIRSVKMHALRSVLARYGAFREEFADLEALIAEESSGLASASALSPEERQARLPEPGHKPRKVTVTMQTFVRNQYVVAEVLFRANGHCEHCKEKALFDRLKDSTPYLEVHHKIRLVDDGDDTVANAIALCPNCHREVHHGVDRGKFGT